MEHHVTLARVPAGLSVPPELSDRVQLDPAARRLAFHGFMSKAEFDQLYLLSEDWGYRRSLEELFRQCTMEDEKPRAAGLGRLTKLFGLGARSHPH